MRTKISNYWIQISAFRNFHHSFFRHFHALKEEYGEVTVVNLLGSKEGEMLLSKAYEVRFALLYKIIDRLLEFLFL